MCVQNQVIRIKIFGPFYPEIIQLTSFKSTGEYIAHHEWVLSETCFFLKKKPTYVSLCC